MGVKYYLAFLGVLITSLFFGIFVGLSPQGQEPLAPAPQTITFDVSKDTYIAEASPTTNYGNSMNLNLGQSVTGQRYDILLDFSLFPIPPGSNVISATLTFSPVFNKPVIPGNPDGAMKLYADAVDASWTETVVTWDNKPTSTNLADPTTTISAPSNYVINLNVTNIVHAWLAGTTPKYGFRIYNPTIVKVPSIQQVNARENLSNAATLKVIYYNPTPTPTRTNTATSTATATSTSTATQTVTPTTLLSQTPTPTGTQTNTATVTPTRTNTATNTATATQTNTATKTATPTSTKTNTPTSTPTDVCSSLIVIPASRDAYVFNGSKTGNYGTETVLKVGKDIGAEYQSLLYFPISDYIPAGRSITSANLRIKIQSTAEGLQSPWNLSYYSLASTWTEAGITWSTRPAESVYFGTFPVYASDTQVLFTVTGMVSSWYQTPSANHGMGIKPNSGDYMVFFKSRENTAPVLEVACSGPLPPSATPTVTRTPTATPTPFVIGSCPGTLKIYASADGWTDQTHPTTVHGTENNLHIGYENGAQFGYLYFPFNASMIPQAQFVQSARVYLHFLEFNNSPRSELRAGALTKGLFTESALSWNLAPMNTTAAGFSEVIWDTQNVHSVDVSLAVNQWRSGSLANNGLLLETYSADLVYVSRESSSVANRPYLEIVCSGTAPTATPTRTPTATPTPTRTPTASPTPIRYRIIDTEIMQGPSYPGISSNCSWINVSCTRLVTGKASLLRVWVGAYSQAGTHLDLPGSYASVSVSAVYPGQIFGPSVQGLYPRPNVIRTDTWNRGWYTDSFYVELPPFYMSDPLHLTIHVSGLYQDPTDVGNQDMVVDVQFYDPPPICAIFMRVSSKGGKPLKMYMLDTVEGDAMKARALSLMPTNWMWSYGSTALLEAYDWAAVKYVPYDMDNESDMENVIATLWFYDQTSDDPDECDAIGARTHYIGMVVPEKNSQNGMGRVGGDQMWFVLRTGDANGATYNNFGINKPWGGRSLAHELGHNYDFGHIGCGTSQDEHDYPYDPCDFAKYFPATPNEGWYWWDPITKAIIPPSADIGDLMSYANLRLTSNWTWNKWLHRLVLQAGFDQQPAAQTNPMAPGYLVVSGVINPTTGDLRVTRTQRMTGDLLPGDKLAEILGNPAATSPYMLKLLDSGGGTLLSQAILTSSLSTDASDLAFFGLAIPWVEGAAQIQLTQNFTTPVVVHAQSVSLHAPTVTLLSPNGGETLAEPLTIIWEAADLDGDRLFYTVQYSDNNGYTWNTLAADYISKTLLIEPESLPGSIGQSLIRVIASDGIQTGSDVSDAAFSLAKHTPRVSIDQPADNTEYILGEPVFLIGSAFDLEDGYLDGTQFEWSIQGKGVVGMGARIGVYDLPVGDYAITLESADSDGSTARQTIIVHVRSNIRQVFLPVIKR